MRNILLKTLAVAQFASIGTANTTATSIKESKKPNIIFVLADDMGWSDPGYNGGANGFYETPNIDALTKEGLTFNRFYPGGPNCAPSRACILTGMYTPRTKIYQPKAESKGNTKDMRFMVPSRNRKNDNHLLDSRKSVDASVISIAEVLNSAGYVTSRIGKWHIGTDTQGFDESTADGYELWSKQAKGADKKKFHEKRFYNDPLATERMTKAAKEFIDRNTKKPFFLYFSLWDVHTPLVAKKDKIKKYKEKWKNWPDKSMRWNPVYAAMMEEVDICVGELRKKLKDTGLEEKTLFIFASDNGGVGKITRNYPLKGAKGALYEGGIRTPAAAVWPQHIKPATKTDVPVTGVDFLPTLAELSGAKLPKNQPVDGTSFVPLLKGKNLKKRAIFWHYPLYLTGNNCNRGWQGDKVLPIYGTNKMNWRAVPASAIMKGDWKLIYFYEYERYELYNLSNDIGETNDLSEKNPKKAKRLYKELMKWAKNTDADIPTKENPEFESGISDI